MPWGPGWQPPLWPPRGCAAAGLWGRFQTAGILHLNLQAVEVHRPQPGCFLMHWQPGWSMAQEHGRNTVPVIPQVCPPEQSVSFETFKECFPVMFDVCSLFQQDIRMCWKPCFSRALSSLVETTLLGNSPQFLSDKTLFYSYYRLFVDYLHQKCIISSRGKCLVIINVIYQEPDMFWVPPCTHQKRVHPSIV